MTDTAYSNLRSLFKIASMTWSSDDVDLVKRYFQEYERPDSVRGPSLEDEVMRRFGHHISPPSTTIWNEPGIGDVTVVDGSKYVIRISDGPDGRKMPCWVPCS